MSQNLTKRPRKIKVVLGMIFYVPILAGMIGLGFYSKVMFGGVLVFIGIILMHVGCSMDKLSLTEENLPKYLRRNP